MVRDQEIEHFSEDRFNEYVGSLTSQFPTTTGESALEEYLLERAAAQLRAARQRLDELGRKLDNP